MNQFELQDVPIIMVGGVWNLSEWSDWINNPEIGKIAFQFGTRPLLTVESPIPEEWKKRLLTIKKGEVSLHRFSPTGFYSSAVKNNFLKELEDRSLDKHPIRGNRQMSSTKRLKLNLKKAYYIKHTDKSKILNWIKKGFSSL